MGKLTVQLGGAALLIWAGLTLAPGWPAWLSLPLTVFWIVGITNAVNLLDNMDGLAAGISGIAALTIAVIGWQNGQPELVAGSMVLAAAAGGFLVYNFYPARTFMGDCGSLFLGFSLAGLALTISSPGMGPGVGALPLVPAAVMAVPILDTTLVTVKRMFVGRSIAEGGRDHASHRLVALGLSDRSAVLTLYGLAAAFGVGAVAIHLLEVAFAVSVAVFAGLGLSVFGAFLSTVRVYDPRTEELGRARGQGIGFEERPLIRFLLQHRRTIVGTGVDALIVLASLLAAFHLYNATLPQGTSVAMVQALQVAVVVKLLVFHGLGLYRGLWWYAGSPEIARTLVGSAAASMAAVAAFVLALPGIDFPRSVLALDWVLTSIGLVGVRFGFRWIRGLFEAIVPHEIARRVLVYGAGSRGVTAVRTMRHQRFEAIPVGFLDDDPEKVGRRLLGLPILGRGCQAASVAREWGVSDILVALPAEEASKLEGLGPALSEQGITLHQMYISLGTLDCRTEDA